MLMELAYRLAVDESPYIRYIRDHVVTLITPVVEVDGAVGVNGFEASPESGRCDEVESGRAVEAALQAMNAGFAIGSGNFFVIHGAADRGLWVKERQPGWSDMEWQVRNWLYFTWLSGDHNVEQHIHSLDKALWLMGD
jgi:hypothetical protein